MTSVMLVDDDPTIRAVGEMSLNLVGGFQVIPAASGPEAIDLALQTRPDVMLLDMRMPGTDGLDTLRQIRLRPALDPMPVIFLTAQIQARDIDDYLSAGAIGVIAKPFDPMGLPGEVARLVDAGRQKAFRRPSFAGTAPPSPTSPRF